MFKKLLTRTDLHVKLYSNKIEITNLETGESVSQTAVENFSTPRIVIGNFAKANTVIKSILKELNIRNTVFGPKILMQQMEKLEGGLSDIEKRAMRDLAEDAGAKYVLIADHTNSLSVDEARLILKTERQ